MKRYLFACAITFISFIHFSGQVDPDCLAEKDFLIIYSTKDYKQELLVAQKATKALSIPIDLRCLIPDNDTSHGLTLPPDTCAKLWDGAVDPDSTCYVARGRFDDGPYISIEYSSAYRSFERGYYIVMVESRLNGDKRITSTLEKVQAVDGWIAVPDGPGLGVTLNEEFVKAHLVCESQ